MFESIDPRKCSFVSGVQCQVPEKVVNGYISAPDEAYFGDTIDVNCDLGYRLSGSATVTCQANQQFENIPECMGMCEKIPPEPDLPIMLFHNVDLSYYSQKRIVALDIILHHIDMFNTIY